MPGADLLYRDSYTGLTDDVVSGESLGASEVQGTPTQHKAYRFRDVDWQIWIEDGPRPLPRKNVITTKNIEGAPENEILKSDWNLDPKLQDDLFKFCHRRVRRRSERTRLCRRARHTERGSGEARHAGKLESRPAAFPRTGRSRRSSRHRGGRAAHRMDVPRLRSVWGGHAERALRPVAPRRPDARRGGRPGDKTRSSSRTSSRPPSSHTFLSSRPPSRTCNSPSPPPQH